MGLFVCRVSLPGGSDSVECGGDSQKDSPEGYMRLIIWPSLIINPASHHMQLIIHVTPCAIPSPHSFNIHWKVFVFWGAIQLTLAQSWAAAWFSFFLFPAAAQVNGRPAFSNNQHMKREMKSSREREQRTRSRKEPKGARAVVLGRSSQLQKRKCSAISFLPLRRVPQEMFRTISRPHP